jgi:two-component system, cell cycle response regulator
MPMNSTRETRRNMMGKDFMGIKLKNSDGSRFVDSSPQVVHGKRIELLVNTVFDVAGLRQSLKESLMIADFCTTVSASLLPEKVLLAAAKKLYEYFAYKFMVVSYDATADFYQEAFCPGDIEKTPGELKTVLGIFPELKKQNIRGYKSLGLPCPGEYAVSGDENCYRLPFAKGAVSFVTDSDLNQVFSPSFMDRILESFAAALQNAREFWRVKEQSMRDSLTGLFNRRVLDELLELEEHKRRADPLSLLVIDLDNFKKINDTYGHPAGDLVLQAVGKVLRDNSRGSDLVVRNGGEEFAVLLPSTSATIALEVGERMRKSLENTLVTYNGSVISITGSVGIAHRSGKDVFPVRDLVVQADEALYHAKKSGKNRVCFYSASPVLINTNRIPTGLGIRG